VASTPAGLFLCANNTTSSSNVKRFLAILANISPFAPASCYTVDGGQSMVTEELLTVREVAERLKVHEETVRRWLGTGNLKGYRPGGKKTGWRIPDSELDRFVKAGSEGSDR
jgi:excisionase family DNA binding protein